MNASWSIKTSLNREQNSAEKCVNEVYTVYPIDTPKNDMRSVVNGLDTPPPIPIFFWCCICCMTDKWVVSLTLSKYAILHLHIILELAYFWAFSIDFYTNFQKNKSNPEDRNYVEKNEIQDETLFMQYILYYVSVSG